MCPRTPDQQQELGTCSSRWGEVEKPPARPSPGRQLWAKEKEARVLGLPPAKCWGLCVAPKELPEGTWVWYW